PSPLTIPPCPAVALPPLPPNVKLDVPVEVFSDIFAILPVESCIRIRPVSSEADGAPPLLYLTTHTYVLPPNEQTSVEGELVKKYTKPLNDAVGCANTLCAL